ncbi:MAG: hypothetical protein IJW59_02390 [Clostridia bacterium]|nr:hypothetical protein [Clostridia bacterium]
MSRVKILSVKQNRIICRVKSKNSKLLIPFCLSIIIAFVVMFSFGGVDVQSVGGRMGYVFDPVNSLYNDNGSIVFTSAGYYVSKEKLDFVIPMLGASMTIDESGTIDIVVGNSIMVKAIESGVVEDIGISLNGIKYIKIRHSKDIVSEIQNVDIVGVNVGASVKKGLDIATSKENTHIFVKIFDCEKQVKNIKIIESKIIWEK